MKLFHLALTSTIAASLLGGCLAQPGDELLEPGAADEAAATADDAGDDAAALELAARSAIDARALTARGIMADGGLVPAPPTNAEFTAFYTGTIPVGATYSYRWTNISPDYLMRIGLSPLGATTSAACQLDLVRQWDEQRADGVRELYFQIKNTGAIGCGANVQLSGRSYMTSWAIGGLAPGSSKTWTWRTGDGAFFAAASPSGATSGDNCKLEVTREWYTREPSSYRVFAFTIKNVGAIACQGNALLARTTTLTTTFSAAYLAPGASHSTIWNHAPTNRIYAVGITPSWLSQPCSLEVTRDFTRQVINTDGTVEREFGMTYKNVGAVSCGGTIELHHMPE